jgi:hypothetical protein
MDQGYCRNWCICHNSVVRIPSQFIMQCCRVHIQDTKWQHPWNNLQQEKIGNLWVSKHTKKRERRYIYIYIFLTLHFFSRNNRHKDELKLFYALELMAEHQRTERSVASQEYFKILYECIVICLKAKISWWNLISNLLQFTEIIYMAVNWIVLKYKTCKIHSKTEMAKSTDPITRQEAQLDIKGMQF